MVRSVQTTKKEYVPMTNMTECGEASTVVNGVGKTVLVVEDNDLNMMLFHDLLEAQGYSVLQARDGMEGWNLAQKRCPDLIVMDIQLPDVSGLEVTKWLKEDETLKSIPIIAVTAFAMVGDEEKYLEGGCDAYISKPISISNFVHAIERFGSSSHEPVENRN